MKKLIIIINIVLLSSLTSCYKDLSTEATMTIPNIEIGNTDSVINISYNDVLRIDPMVSQEGRGPEDFSYFWQITLTTSGSQMLELGDSPILEYQVASLPSSSPYYLFLAVTDKQTGAGEIKSWKVYVSSLLGEGLLVAATRDGGQTSDLDFVASKRLTYGYSDSQPAYRRNLYSEYNGAAYSGIINSMSYNIASTASGYDTPRLLLGSKNELFSVNLTTSMERELSTSDLFSFFSEENCDVTYVGNFSDYNTVAIVDSMLYLMGCGMSNQFAPVSFSLADPNIFSKANTSLPKGDPRNMTAFDVNSGKFYFLHGGLASQSTITEVNASPTFQIAECLAAGPISESRSVFVVKTDSGEYKCIALEEPSDPASNYTEYSLSAPDIENAVSFAFCENTAIFYYATPDAVYANIIAGTNLQTRQITSFSPDSPDEKITAITHYQQAWFGTHNYATDYDFVLDTHQTQMLIVTYNENTGEGKIYVKPFNLNSGLFSMTDQGETYDGFGEITAIAPVPR